MHRIIVVRGNGIDPAPHRRGRKAEVLADVPGILMDFPLSALAVAPGHPVWDSDPEKDHPAPHDKLLSQAGIGYPDVKGWFQVE